MKFILITKQSLNPQTVSVTSKAFYDSGYKTVFETIDFNSLRDAIKIPPERINITVKGQYLTEALLRAITPSYLRGTQIVINGVEFAKCKANPQYFYTWQDRIPDTLPEHLKKAYREFRLRGKLYDELVAWNQGRIKRAIDCSKFKWSLAEQFYKNVFKTFYNKLNVQSPNKKTFYESIAELDVESYITPEPPLTKEEELYLELADLKHYSRAFGLQDCDIRIGTHHRTTPNGTTEEPMLVSLSDIKATSVALSFAHKDQRELEGFIDDSGFEVKSWDDTSSMLVRLHRRERENIITLKYFLSLPKKEQEFFLMPGWHFCPVCGKLYNELDGCYDLKGNCHVEPVEFVPYNDDTHDNEEDYPW